MSLSRRLLISATALAAALTAAAPAFAQARVWAKAGHQVLLNARLTRSEFRKGSISL